MQSLHQEGLQQGWVTAVPDGQGDQQRVHVALTLGSQHVLQGLADLAGDVAIP